MAQDLPLKSIPLPPKDTDSGNIISRMVQGLGYRYYWATKDLRQEDLSFRPSSDASSTLETMQHIYELSEMIYATSQKKNIIRPLIDIPESYGELRKRTLIYIKNAEETFAGQSASEVGEFKLVFERGGKQSVFPIWNLLNGPLSDALYHTGQLVSFRRTSGNPIQKGVNVFLGKTKE